MRDSNSSVQSSDSSNSNSVINFKLKKGPGESESTDS